ncbi:MAG: ATP-binding cassette domain-containing protein [Chloroflexi bacterium]|nr:ATP-binding cassette domain-containing protein [Chloroflexota bacterium]MDA1228881.1 ATP-binding cassette domain-containing protein [Chloroflexota bacterium]
MTSLDSQSAPFLTLSGVQKAYNGQTALAPLSLSVRAGESIAIVGPSGSGKTTLLNLMAGVIQPDSGAIILGGHQLAGLRPNGKLSRLVGVIPQQFDLVPHLSVLHNVLAGRLGNWGLIQSLMSLVWPQERQLALQALERVGIPEKIEERASRLSGGEQQRVAIARLLVQDPQMIIADEPVSSLDPARAEDVLDMLTGIARERGKTLIASIHTLDISSSYFDRVLGLREGSLLFDLPMADLCQQQLTSLYQLKETGIGVPAGH